MVKIEKPDDEDEDGYLIHNYYYSASYNGGFQYQLGSLDNKSRYTSSNKSEYGSFGAGSYSDYNQWRRQLALVAGYGDVENVWDDESFDTIIVFDSGDAKYAGISEYLNKIKHKNTTK